MNNFAKVISLDENVEEEAVIQINDIEFVTFIAYAPYFVEINKQYPIAISLFGDDVKVKENTVEKKSLIRNGETFGYTINGYLNDQGQLDVGFLIEDDIFEDYHYLHGKYITLAVDRIDSEFIIQNDKV